MSPLPSSSLPPIPPPIPVETHPNRASSLKASSPSQTRSLPDPDRLAPEDAYSAKSLGANCDLRIRSLNRNDVSVAALRQPPAVPPSDPTPKELRKVKGGSRRRTRKGAWKKLLWVKQSYPDNYTDTETFLDHLQRNPRVRPYDFWPLVADSTVIVQHVSSVVIFVCCFVGIVQERVSPVSVVCWGTVATAMGWVLWDSWVWKEHDAASRAAQAADGIADGDDGSSSGSTVSLVNPSARTNQKENQPNGKDPDRQLRRCSMGLSGDSYEVPPEPTTSHPATPTANGAPDGSCLAQHHSSRVAAAKPGRLSSRSRQRLTTLKSALMIYFSLLGLSPILKSLTKSTASDSIWAMSCWLLIMNIFSFDYGSGEGAGATKFPASLSTNAAVMASTVLASRLPSTTHVFSLMLFSIEVFGLFPIFRRQLRHTSWTGHAALTLALVITAGGAVGITLRGGWASAIVGSFLGSILTAFSMGGCSWWLISLQKYKNVVTGPWDPARPILRRRWD
ncbi:hypothetical protein MAP00_008313 [Monascus purpureus]|nr:hypothetical protein MAP00_008313 [Monascus purpureus]